uniref:Uncharacterized protein n=1 Tax=uncultured Desulfobacterium sp. TaxID=201089 RepID=E1YGP4_9BACT|nr:unknown protein [uncultured Desulfobacterium sp.]
MAYQYLSFCSNKLFYEMKLIYNLKSISERFYRLNLLPS